MGIGGGIVVVPALIFLFQNNSTIPAELIMPMAIGTSLAVMVVTAQATIRFHYKKGNIAWPIYKLLAPGIALGTVCGALLTDKLPTDFLKILFAVFLVFIAFKMLFDMHQKAHPRHNFPSRYKNQLISFFIGCQSGLLGIGGGALVIPYLNYCGLDIKKITPIAALCTITVAVIGTFAFISIGAFKTNLPAFSSGFVYWPAVIGIAIPSSFLAPFGARLTYLLPVKHLKYFFILLLLATTIELLIV
ncbi:MAG: sulfite exporter TauE/SafE family protein [Tatlockia sp.]|nr:sulfite exporter TauE/SafE family protein [Tatlockia sp.]